MSERWENSAEHRDKQKKRAERLYNDATGRARALIRCAIKRRPEGFTLTEQYVVEGIERGTCAVTGLRFRMDNDFQKEHGVHRNPFAPSIDRIDSKLGYTNENVRVVCAHVNIMKGELTDSQLAMFCGAFLEGFN
jgi:hypothetical protein